MNSMMKKIHAYAAFWRELGEAQHRPEEEQALEADPLDAQRAQLDLEARRPHWE